jgi:3-hydroxybutyryl-CoA dehydratase
MKIRNVHLETETNFEDRIAHGMMAAGLVSGVIGMELPGPRTVYVE